MEELEDRIKKDKGRKIRKLGFIGTVVALGTLALYGTYTGITDLVNSKREQEIELLEETAKDINRKTHIEGGCYTKEDFRFMLTKEGMSVLDKIGRYDKLEDTIEEDTKEILDFAEKNASVIKGSRALSDLFNAVKYGYEKSKQAEKELPGFLEYLDKNWKQFYEKVANEEFEQGGLITRKNGCHEIVFKEDPMHRLIRSYISEIVEGNFSHENELMSFVKKHAKLRFRDNPEMEDKLVSIVKDNVGTLKEAYKKNEKDIPEDIALRCGGALCLVRNLARLSYSIITPKELLNPDSGLIFVWHTHPTAGSAEDTHGPSQPDKSTSTQFGPMMVFAVYPDKMEVYSTILGESKLERTYKVK